LIYEGRAIPIRGSAEITPIPFTGDLNDWNVIVGSGNQPFSGFRAGWIWTETEGMRDLNKLIATNSGWYFAAAFDINNHGQITGMGGFEGRGQAFRLDPIPPKPTISRSGTNVVVSWSPAWPGILLESSSAIGSTNWSAVSAGVTNVVRLSLGSTNRFFRLNLDSIRGLCCAP
jgi:hypothetical protein